MRLEFRKLGEFTDAPAAGELLLRTGSPGIADRRDFAALVIEQGPTVFPHGSGELETIVLPADPTLDDLLAALLIQWTKTRGTLPDAAKTFARYTALVREGLKPCDIPLESSLEGIFLAIRNTAGEDLTDPATGARFLSDWSRMEQQIVQALEKGADPFKTRLFDDAEFSRERAFLTKDREVYRQDVARGERWIVQLPGGPPRASGLLLRHPKSLLWKYWSRQDTNAPTGEAYLLLGVTFQKGHWAFSTDPVQRLSLKGLADELQSHEKQVAPNSASDDPWFDGKPFNHTLIAAPKGGTKLDEQRLLRVVKRWCHAGNAKTANRRRMLPIGLASAATLVIAFGLFHLFGKSVPQGETPKDKDDRNKTNSRNVRKNNGNGEKDNPPRFRVEPGKSRLCLLNIGVSKYQHSEFDLTFAHKDAGALKDAFLNGVGGLFEKVVYQKVLIDGDATQDAIFKELKNLKRRMLPSDVAVVTISGHGKRDEYGNYYFLPHNYDPEKDERVTAISWHDFMVDLGESQGLVIVVLDTCHSGAATKGAKSRGFALDRSEMEAKIKKIAGNLKQQTGLVIIGASLGNQRAGERSAWGHGALSLALLEALQGHRLFTSRNTEENRDADEQLAKVSKDGLVDLDELLSYLRRRVQSLNGNQQAVASSDTGGLDYTSIYLAKTRKE